MNKLLSSLLIILLLGCENQEFSEKSVREVLMNASSGKFDEAFSEARKIYYQLLDNGEEGYALLAESWAYDKIPEVVWAQWSYDYQTRHGNSAESKRKFDEYSLYIDEKLLSSEEYYESVQSKLVDSSLNPKAAVIEMVSGWLDPNIEDSEYLPGHRKLGYDVLKKHYPNIPQYAYASDAADRNNQYTAIMRFLEKSLPAIEPF